MMSARMIHSAAANIKGGLNPTYTKDDFRRAMPQFTGELIADELLDQYVSMANSIVSIDRWHGMWREGMRLLIAHFATIYLSTTADPATGPAGALNAAKVEGAITEKSVGGVSIKMNPQIATNDLTGWASYKQTAYGAQFATFAKLFGKGGMAVR